MLRPDDVWPVDGEYEELYRTHVDTGRAIASESSLNIVSIARNAMPLLTNTLGLVDEVRKEFRTSQMFVFENDSTDGTAEALDGHALRNDWFHVQHDTWGGIDSRGFEKERTERLAKARNICMEWVRENGSDNYYTIVLDLDPDYGFSPEGVLNSIGWMGDSFVQARAMASYSLYKVKAEDGNIALAQYDSWAARLNWWRDRRDDPGGMGWFSLLMPPVGSPPIPMNSAFGGLCVYRTEAYLAGGYSGEDCEHVPHHYRMALAGHRLFLNPGCRYIAVWQ